MKKTPTRPATATDIVRKAVANCGMSRYELSRKSGVTEAALCRFASGMTGMNLRTLERLSPFIGVRVVYDQPKQ